jgi:hypothetical protein
MVGEGLRRNRTDAPAIAGRRAFTRLRDDAGMPLICPTCQVAFSDGGGRRLLCMGLFSIFCEHAPSKGSSRTAPSGRRSGEDVDQTHKHECADACRQDRARRASDPEQQESGAYAGKGQQLRSQRDRAALPPHTQRRPEVRMGEQAVFEPWRRSCEARRGENEERRRRQHRQECADKAEGDEDKAENKVNATHQPQPSCKSEGLSFQPRPSRASDPSCPARVTAQVTGHVYDTSTGKFLLHA